MEENKKKDLEFLNPFQKEVHETLEGLLDKAAEGAERGYLVISYERNDKEIQVNATHHGDPNLLSAAIYGLLIQADSVSAIIIHRAMDQFIDKLVEEEQKEETAQESEGPTSEKEKEL